MSELKQGTGRLAPLALFLAVLALVLQVLITLPGVFGTVWLATALNSFLAPIVEITGPLAVPFILLILPLTKIFGAGVWLQTAPKYKWIGGILLATLLADPYFFIGTGCYVLGCETAP